MEQLQAQELFCLFYITQLPHTSDSVTRAFPVIGLFHAAFYRITKISTCLSELNHLFVVPLEKYRCLGHGAAAYFVYWEVTAMTFRLSVQTGILLF